MVMGSWRRSVLGLIFLLAPGAAPAQPRTAQVAGPGQGGVPLVDLAARASAAVVQLQVTGFGPADEEKVPGVVVRQRSIGSGVVLDPEGWILTNAHVVEGARLIEVQPSVPFHGTARQVYRARLVGADPETDLAVVKIDAKGLPTLPLGDGREVRPGQQVMAVGSPEGLINSVTLGIVSAVRRQADPDWPMEFIQTDAPTNPGNSGGPLVDLDGFVVGLNSLMITESGGSQGMGFAIPARVLRFVYEQIRRTGRVARVDIQARAQAVNPGLAAGLGLARDWGVVICDVLPGGTADMGGLRPKDVVLAVDGHPVLGLPSYHTALSTHPPGTPMTAEILRGATKVVLSFVPREGPRPAEPLASRVSPDNRLDRLGVFAATLTPDLAAVLPPPRTPSGVVVLALSPDPKAVTNELQPGDLIHALDDAPIATFEQLTEGLRRYREGDKGVLTVEREGGMRYLVFEAP